jgi:hypothetical protein
MAVHLPLSPLNLGTQIRESSARNPNLALPSAKLPAKASSSELLLLLLVQASFHIQSLLVVLHYTINNFFRLVMQNSLRNKANVELEEKCNDNVMWREE